MTTDVARRAAGALLRDWRQRRHRSQMDLALDTGVSTRHLSFVETGRSKASPELLLALAEQLQVPLRERNSLLLAAGYAPRYRQSQLDDPAVSPARAALANQAAGRLAAVLPPELAGPPMNVFRACLHPDGLARSTLNFPEWAAYLLGQLDRLRLVSADPAVSDLAEEVRAYPNVAALGDWRSAARSPAGALLVPWRVDLGGTELSLFTTLTVFGAPNDVTLAEVAVELFYPADDKTAGFLRQRR